MKLGANVGNLDLVLRAGGGLLLVLLTSQGVIGAWGYLGLLIALTGAARFCPLYAVFGLSTLRKPHAHK